MVKINLKALDRDIFIQGDDAVARTIQIGQTVTVEDIVIIDAENWSIDVDGNAALDGTLAVTGLATVGGTFAVTGTSAFTGAATYSGGVSSPTPSSGDDNEAFGSGALGAITTGANTTAIGSGAGSAMTSGTLNTFIGKDAGNSVETGSGVTVIGAEAAQSLAAGSINATAIGFRAMNATTNDNMVAIGANAMRYSNGDNNLAIGTQAMLGSSVTEHTGQFNIAIGANALLNIEGGVAWNNTAIGGDSLKGLTTGGGNTCIGKDTGEAVTTGGSNVFIGNGTGNTTTTGSSNVLIGSGLTTDAATDTGQLKIHFAGGSNTPIITGDMVAGKLGVNTEISNIGATLHVETDSGDGIPCLELQQDSVAEPFIELDATSAASTVNPLTSYTSGATIQGHFRISVNGTDRWVPFYDAPTS